MNQPVSSLRKTRFSRPAGLPSIPSALALAVWMALATASGPVDAAGLGRLTVQSALGQPFRGEVEVTSLTAEESQSLSARLAPADAFRQAGLEYNPALGGLRFTVEPRAGRTFIKINSNQPINEPFVDLLLELNWATGKLVREYTVLLDPPQMRDARASADAQAPVVAPPLAAAASPAARPARAAAPSRRAAPERDPAAAAPPKALVSDAGSPGAVTVRQGDTLGRIAANVRPDGVSLEQSMIAIYRANPSAFLGNLNLVRQGSQLSIPSAESMASIGAAEASQEVRIQSTDFAAYRRKLAEAATRVDTPRAGQTASGAVTGRVEDRAVGESGDRLRLSKPGLAGTNGSAVGSQAGSGAEQSVARDAALKEANSRIADLEKNVDDLKKMLELRNRAMADVQRQLEETRAGQKPVAGTVGEASPAPQAQAPQLPSPPPQVAPASEPSTATEPKAEAPVVAAAEVPAEKTAETPQASQAAPATPAVPAAPPAPASPASPAAPVAEASLLDDLLDNPLLLPGIGGVAALGLGYAMYAMRRRRKVEKFEDSLIAADAFASNSLFGATGGQSVDTNHSGFSSITATQAEPQATEVDPIAEADVYIAYGREAQAQDILREALLRQPTRQPIRLKLMQIYASRNDVEAFGALATDMHEMTGGQGEEWDKAAALGLSIDPINPLYGGAAAGTSFDAVSSLADRLDLAAPTANEASPDEFDFPDLESQASLDADAQRFSPEPIAAVEPEPIEAVAPEPLAERTAQPIDMPSLDFDLDLDEPQKAVDIASMQAVAFEPSLAAPMSSDAALQPDSLGFDLDLAEIVDAPATASRAERSDLGLHDLDLDLESVAVADDAPEFAATSTPRWQEMSTKLDLALAYDEIGDKEGARELLQEVISGGDAGQQQKARTLLSRIA